MTMMKMVIGLLATFIGSDQDPAYPDYRLRLVLTSFIGGQHQTRIINLTLSCELVEGVLEDA